MGVDLDKCGQFLEEFLKDELLSFEPGRGKLLATAGASAVF